MPTSTPPPPPPIEHSISLDERLGFAAEQVKVPGKPGQTVSPGLAHVPSRMNIVFGPGEDDAPVLELSFEFLEHVKEPIESAVVRKTQGRYGVEMSVGAHTGRIYRLAMRVVDLSDESVRVVTEGIGACFNDYVASHNAPLRQQAILHSMASLVATLLPSLVKQVRESIEK